MCLGGVALAHDVGHQETNMVGPDVTDTGIMNTSLTLSECDANGMTQVDYSFEGTVQPATGLGWSEISYYGSTPDVNTITFLAQNVARTVGEAVTHQFQISHKQYFESAVTEVGSNPAHPSIYRLRTAFCPPQPQPFGDMDGMNPTADDTYFILDITVGECAYNENLDADVTEVSWTLTPNGNFLPEQRPRGAFWWRKGNDTEFSKPSSITHNDYGFMRVERETSYNSYSQIGWETGQPYMYFQMVDERLRLPNNPPDMNNMFDPTADDFTSHLVKVGTNCPIPEIANTGNYGFNMLVVSASIMFTGAWLFGAGSAVRNRRLNEL